MPTPNRIGPDAPATWHHGLVAEWWAEFNIDGPEIDYFGTFVREQQPALDAGCGTGRLLIPWLRAGYDVDGSDVSADMLAHCAKRAESESFAPTLLRQALHELDPPRRYRTIVVCGVFGLGSTRAQDQEALHRIRDSLEPGGTLLLDNEVPYANPRLWQWWAKERRKRLPQTLREREPDERRPTADGAELAMWSRVVDFDPLDQTFQLEMQAFKWRSRRLIAQEDQQLTMRMYFRDELLLMLAQAGFTDVHVRGGYADEPPTGDHDFLVYVARR